MPLDREAIQRSDFPTVRRGYDPAAVDEHLTRLAGRMEHLQRKLDAAERRPREEPAPASLAGAAADRVRAIVQAAEASATEIERGARAEAERIRSEAMARSSGHVADVERAADELRERLEGIGGRLDELVEAFRDGLGRLGGDLARLRGRLSELYGEATAAQAAPAEGEPEAAAPEPEVIVSEPLLEREPVEEPEPEPVAESSEEPEPEPEPAAPPALRPAPAGADVEGARLIALNMALNGQPRAETERYLVENFGEIPGRAGLLDEVYASVQG